MASPAIYSKTQLKLKIGATYVPVEGVNVEALLEGGFVIQSPTTAPKGAKTKTDTNKE